MYIGVTELLCLQPKLTQHCKSLFNKILIYFNSIAGEKKVTTNSEPQKQSRVQIKRVSACGGNKESPSPLK